jgi:hypothetical protein
MEIILKKLERKIRRKIDGSAYENGRWRIEMNRGSYNKFKSPDILTVTEVRRLEWLSML